MTTEVFGKELFIRFTASAFRKLLSMYVFTYFPFGFEGRMWDLIVSVPDHCLSFYFSVTNSLVSDFTLTLEKCRLVGEVFLFTSLFGVGIKLFFLCHPPKFRSVFLSGSLL